VISAKAAQRKTVDDYMTIEQAEALIPRIKPLLEAARRHKREVEAIAAHYNYDSNLLQEERPRIGSIMGQLGDIMNELEELGCYVNDLDIGLVDFLSQFEGRDIFLCWKLGEKNVTHWHEVDEGFSRRKEILDMSQLELEIDFEIPYVENEN